MSGDIIQLLDGTYGFQLRLTDAQNGVTLRGGAGVLLHGGTDGIGDDTNGIYIQDASSQDITVDGQGMVFDGQSVNGCGVHVYGSDHVIKDMEIKFSGTQGVCGNPLRATFQNLNVHHSGVDSNLNRVLACFDSVTDCGGFGSQQACRDALFDPNEHGHCHGYYLFSGSSGTGNNQFIGGSSNSNDGWGVHSYDSGNQLAGVTIHTNAAAGIAEAGCNGGFDGTKVKNSVFYGNNWSVGGWALNLGCANGNAYNNTFEGNTETGLRIEHSSVAARNNVFVDNGTNLDNTAPSSNVSHNLCFGTGGTTGCAETTDPEFANVPSHDYRISDTGGAAGAGTDLSGVGVTDDFDGNPRSAPYDIGAFVSGDVTPSTARQRNRSVL